MQKFQQKLKPNHLEFLAATYTRAAVRSNKHLGFPLTPSHQCTASAFQTFLRTFGTTRTLQQALIIAVSNELYEAEHMLDYVQRTLLLLQHHHQFPPAENHYLHELTRLLSHLLQHRLQRDERHRKTTLQAYEVRLTMAGIPRAQVKNYAQAISRMSLSCLSRLSPSFLRQYKHNLTLERGKRIFRVLESMAKNQAPIQKIPELPRLKNNLLYTGNRDAWNHPYLLHRTPTHVHLKSLGPDGKASQDDITIGSIQLSAPTILTPKKPSTSRPSSHPTSRPKAR